MRVDDDAPLVSYGESVGPPTSWHSTRTRSGRADNAGSSQQCDDDSALETSYLYVDGLYSNVEGEAIGDFC